MTALHIPGLGPLPPRRMRAPFAFVALGCGGLVLAGIVFALVVGGMVLMSIRRSEAYQAALDQVRKSPTARSALGEPIAPGWWVTGSLEVNGPSGSAKLSFPVSGSRAKATVYVEADKRAGEWNMRLLEVQPEGGGARLDLLDEADASLDAVRAFLHAGGSQDFKAAHAYFSSGLRDLQPLDAFVSQVRGAADLFRTRELRLVKRRGRQGPRYQGSLLLENGRVVPAWFELLREDGGWRLGGYKIGAGADRALRLTWAGLGAGRSR